jgi:hypothetical protein
LTKNLLPVLVTIAVRRALVHSRWIVRLSKLPVLEFQLSQLLTEFRHFFELAVSLVRECLAHDILAKGYHLPFVLHRVVAVQIDDASRVNLIFVFQHECRIYTKIDQLLFAPLEVDERGLILRLLSL